MSKEFRYCACGRKIYRKHNSTIWPKMCPNCQLISMLDGSDEVIRKGLEAKKPRRKKSGKKSPKSAAMRLADDWFSRYIRIKYAYKIQGGEVYCQCIVNRSVIKHAKYFDNGHCYSRDNKTIRYNEDNCRPQNRSSNRYRGEADHYTFIEHLKEEIGEERFNAIDKLRREDGEDNILFYKEQADKYRKLVNELVKKHEINKWW